MARPENRDPEKGSATPGERQLAGNAKRKKRTEVSRMKENITSIEDSQRGRHRIATPTGTPSAHYLRKGLCDSVGGAGVNKKRLSGELLLPPMVQDSADDV
jgi:hypothetical protein